MVAMENDMSMYHYGKCHYGKCHYGKRRGAYQSIEVLTKSHIQIQINNSFLVRINNYLPCRDSNCWPPSYQANILPTELSCFDKLFFYMAGEMWNNLNIFKLKLNWNAQ